MSLALVDFSSIFHRIWHVNRDEAAHNVEAFVNRLNEDEVIICVDSPPYRRKEIEPTYKANRDIPDPELVGEMRATLDRLLNAGYKVARCQGWEADDVIASIAKQNTEDSLIVYATDKDLLQAVDITNPFPKKEENPYQTPESRLGVKREQVVDYLTLVGDSSDNIKGVAGIGDKTAVKMLAEFGSLAGILNAVKEENPRITPKTAASIKEARDNWMMSSAHLATLNRDLVVEYEQRERVVDVNFVQEEGVDDVQSTITCASTHDEPQHIVKHVEVDYRHSIEPIGIDQAYKFSVMASKSALYSGKFKSPEQCMMIVMRGRAFGLDATTSLDAIDMIQGKPTMKAQLIGGIVMASPKCEFLECVELSSTSCTWETKRAGGRTVIKRTFTIEDAARMGLTSKDNWKKQPDVMLQWRCLTAIARQVYPDLTLGIYAPEELE